MSSVCVTNEAVGRLLLAYDALNWFELDGGPAMQLVDREKASRLMNKQGVDLLLASSKHGVGYLADYWHPVSDDYYVPYTGHGVVGRVVHEPPYLALNDATLLEPGMSVTLEPHIIFSGDGDIFVGMEDHFLITNDGAEWLTESAPMGLHV